MSYYANHSRVRGFKLTGEDIAVAGAAAVGVTVAWWEPAYAMLPHIGQGIIVAGTLVYVVARAINEIRKFWRSPKDDS